MKTNDNTNTAGHKNKNACVKYFTQKGWEVLTNEKSFVEFKHEATNQVRGFVANDFGRFVVADYATC